jgi:hypothetical protein
MGCASVRCLAFDLPAAALAGVFLPYGLFTVIAGLPDFFLAGVGIGVLSWWGEVVVSVVLVLCRQVESHNKKNCSLFTQINFEVFSRLQEQKAQKYRELNTYMVLTINLPYHR